MFQLTPRFVYEAWRREIRAWIVYTPAHSTSACMPVERRVLQRQVTMLLLLPSTSRITNRHVDYL
jgi:hypothetical protein